MISIVYDSRLYRKMLAENVSEGDVVIEIGPHLGQSTAGYVEKTKLAVAIDVGEQSEEAFQALQEKHPNLRFLKADARRFETVKKVLELTQSCDLLAVDLGGGRYPDTAFKVWAVWSGVFKPQKSIIRNRGLAEFVQKAKVEDKSVVQSFPGDGWLSTWGRRVPSKLKDQLEEFRFWIDLK